MGYPVTPDAAATHIERSARDPASGLQVLEHDAECFVGLVATHIVPRPDEDARTCRITNVSVDTGAAASARP